MPICYIPEQDPVQMALNLNPESLKCTLKNGYKTCVMVLSGHGTNEQFVLHVNMRIQKIHRIEKNFNLCKKHGAVYQTPQSVASQEGRYSHVRYFQPDWKKLRRRPEFQEVLHASSCSHGEP